MIKLLKYLYVIQERHTKATSTRRTRIERRLNPFNPLSYITLLMVILVGMIMFGVVGFWKEVNIEDMKFIFK